RDVVLTDRKGPEGVCTLRIRRRPELRTVFGVDGQDLGVRDRGASTVAHASLKRTAVIGHVHLSWFFLRRRTDHAASECHSGSKAAHTSPDTRHRAFLHRGRAASPGANLMRKIGPLS